MNRSEIEQKVKAILAKKLNLEPSKIESTSRLGEDLGVDSFGAVEIMFEVEEAFQLKIPDSDIEQVRTVNDIVTYLAHWIEKAAGGSTASSP